VWALARAIATVLGETLPPPLRTITRIVDRLGSAGARALLGQALTVEAQGGLTLPDGRRRTPGGVFFFLVRQSPDVTPDERASIFPLRPALSGGCAAPNAPQAAHALDRRHLFERSWPRYSRMEGTLRP